MPKARTQPDAAPGSGWFHVVDRVFLTLLVLSLACHFGLIAAVSGRTPPEDDLGEPQEIIPDVWTHLVVPRPAAPSPAAPSRPAQRPSAPGHAAPPRKLDRVGLLGIIGAMTAGADSSVGDLLQGGTTTRDLAEAFQGIDHVAAATLDTGLPGSRGDHAGMAAQLGELGTGGGGRVDIGHAREARIAGSVSVESPEPESKDIDRDAMARFVKAHLRSIQGCYERELKLTPNLRGKLAVRLTLSPAGRVGDLEVDEDTLQSAAVVGCIRSVLRGWQLPFRPEAESAVQLSWSFVAGD
jgi:hypothetical protein